MTVNRYLRMAAGIFIILSLVLAKFVSPNWLYFTLFVGLNLLQSSFTNWCPLMVLFRKIGAAED
ncbi:MAG: DUF2892 domain-containing protein [Spirochaetes bacterium]|nr:MAG: DUF2892 domain-containing protein [Spirochaetota bacterium]